MSELHIQAHIKRIAFKCGLDVALTKGDIIVIIGPNNAGKSATLREIVSRAKDGASGKLLEIIELEKFSPVASLHAALAPFADGNQNVTLSGATFPLGMLERWWDASRPTVAIGPFLGSKVFAELSTRERLGDCDPQGLYDRRTPFSAAHPFQHFHRDSRLELRASDLFRRAFKKDLVIHRFNSRNIPAYIGERPKVKRGERVDSTAYADRIEQLDRLEDQGDGMRSFTSILGRILAESRPIILIDEPEAFLHPPQARMIADIIAEESADRQIFIATHSSDVLQGLLTKHATRVSVVRLQRKGASGLAVLLPSADVTELWKDPILRFSNVLDGLFHDAVVVTEGDADCRFYEALAAAVTPAGQLPDIHYAYSGGKDRLPVVINALQGLGVPVVTVADFDLLNNDKPLRTIVEAHRGHWSSIESDWKAVKSAIEASATFVGADQFKRDMQTLIKGIPAGGAVEKTVLSSVKKLARNASPWDAAKANGLASVPSGGPTVAAQRLLSALRAIGIFIVPVGEMEGFYKASGLHGPRWVEDVMKRDLATDTDLVSARSFFGDVVSHLNSKLSS